ncbi:MAG: HAD-IA family hydrolase [Pseudomonadota bacterium]
MTEPVLVIFDCDGTLIDSQHVICAAMDHAFADNGLPGPGREATLEIVGLSLPEAMARLAPDADGDRVTALGASYKAAFNKFRQEFANREPMYEGARETLVALDALEGCLLGIATGKSRRGVDHFLAREAMPVRFATIQTADTARSKPDPDMLMKALSETGVSASRAVMIGDTTYDMEMGRAADVATIAVTWGYHAPRALMTSAADHMVDDFTALLTTLGDLFPDAIPTLSSAGSRPADLVTGG